MKPYSYTLTIETVLDSNIKSILETKLSKIESEFDVSFNYAGKYKLRLSEKHYIDVSIEEDTDILALYEKFSIIEEIEAVTGIGLNLTSGSLSYKLQNEIKLENGQKVAANRQKLEQERKQKQEEKEKLRREKYKLRG